MLQQLISENKTKILQKWMVQYANALVNEVLKKAAM